jgi:hypothetical protein
VYPYDRLAHRNSSVAPEGLIGRWRAIAEPSEPEEHLRPQVATVDERDELLVARDPVECDLGTLHETISNGQPVA